jgi:hypothetical protein
VEASAVQRLARLRLQVVDPFPLAFAHDSYEGVGKYYFPEGNFYEGDFKDGQ